MGLNLGRNLSQDDLDRTKNIRNPPAQDAGDDMSSSDSGFDDIFSDDFGGFDDIFGSDEQSGNDNQLQAGQGDAFDVFQSGQNNQNGMQGSNGGYGNGFNGMNSQGAAVQQKDNWDKFFDFSAEGASNIVKILTEIVKSIKNRTADDLGYLSTNLIKTGGLGIGIFIVLSIISAISKVKFLGIAGISGTFILGFTLTCGMGMVCLGIAALAIASTAKDCQPDIKNMPDAGSQFEDDATDDYEDELGDIMADLFGDDSEDSKPEEAGFESTIEQPSTNDGPDIPDFVPRKTEVNFNEKLTEVQENRLINRKTLVNTFTEFLPLNNPDFGIRKEISSDAEDFLDMETICLKALSNVLKCEIEEVKSSLHSMHETFFSYELKMKRVKGLNKTSDIATEIEAYLRDGPSDTSVTVSVDILGDDYYIVVTKGVTAVVTIGDCLSQPKVKGFFENEKNQLPIITGITELGEVIYDDAKLFDTMLIAGKPRSGKSWYVLSILISLMMFNTPEDVQFIIVDPKESNLFNTLALMPHVAGLHNDEKILEIMDDIIENEGPRRKQLLADNRCDDIWALRKKGVKVPILYFVIDEYISVRNNLGELDKALDAKLQVMISQLPSLGIRLIFVPHRATGVVNKTNRTMLQFTGAVKADVEDVNDTLGIKNWKRPLVNQGDIAIKTSSLKEAKFVRGSALTTSDESNASLIEVMAKAFYKMGVDLPYMGAMNIAVNRDERKIREMLCGDNRIQYDVEHIFNE